MKKIKIIACLFCLIGPIVQAFSQNATDAETYRKRLLSDLVVIYVDKPHRPISDPTASYILNNQDIADNKNLISTFWTNTTNNDVVQELLKMLFQPTKDITDKAKKREAIKLQYYAGRILWIQNKRLKFYIFNDRGNISVLNTNGYHNDWDVNPSGWSIWPHARHQISGSYAGHLKFGTHFFKSMGLDYSKGTFLHELTHTQDNSSFYSSALGPYYYGRNESHFAYELIGNYHASYVEGIANTSKLHVYRFENIYNWMDNNKLLSFEVIPSSACSGLPTNVCLDSYLSSLKPNKVKPASSKSVVYTNSNSVSITYTEEKYKIKDLPSDALVHNETVQAYVFYAYASYFGFARYTKDIQDVMKSTKGKYGFPHLFQKIVESAHAAKPQGGKYFPLAMLDFYTGFKLKDKATLDLCLRTPSTSGWAVKIDDYWTSGVRDKIIALHKRYGEKFSPLSTHGYPQLRDIALQLKVEEPSASETAGANNEK